MSCHITMQGEYLSAAPVPVCGRASAALIWWNARAKFERDSSVLIFLMSRCHGKGAVCTGGVMATDYLLESQGRLLGKVLCWWCVCVLHRGVECSLVFITSLSLQWWTVSELRYQSFPEDSADAALAFSCIHTKPDAATKTQHFPLIFSEDTLWSTCDSPRHIWVMLLLPIMALSARRQRNAAANGIWLFC